MEKNNIMALGWVWGRIEAEINKKRTYDVSGFKFREAAKRPYSGLAQIMTAAHDAGVMKGSLDKEVTEALGLIDFADNNAPGIVENVQPLDMQGIWQLACEKGRKGKKL